MGVLRRGRLEEMVTALVETGVVCPQPAVWNRFWSRIKSLVNDAEPVPMPLILAVWHSATDQRKTERFVEQLMIADRFGFQAEIVDAVSAISDADWYRNTRPDRLAEAAPVVRGADHTVIEPGLVAAYLVTEFVVSGETEVVSKIGARSAVLDALMRWHGAECAAFITAFNPFSESRSPVENQNAQASMLQQLVYVVRCFGTVGGRI